MIKKSQYISVLNCIRGIVLLPNAHISLYGVYLYTCVIVHEYICIRCIESLLEFCFIGADQFRRALIYLCIIWNVICMSNKDI